MKLHNRIIALTMAVAMTAPALAADRDPFAGVEPLLSPQVLFGGLVTENDVSLAFAHLRAAMLAAAEGRESPPVPDELSRRLNTAGEELRVRGTLLGLLLSQVMERAALDALREFAVPPAQAGTAQ